MREGCCHDPSATLWTPRSIDRQLFIDLKIDSCVHDWLIRLHPAFAVDRCGSTNGSQHAPGQHSPASLQSLLFSLFSSVSSLQSLLFSLFSSVTSTAISFTGSCAAGAARSTPTDDSGMLFLLPDGTPELLGCCSGLAPTLENRPIPVTSPERLRVTGDDGIQELPGREYLRKRGSKPYWLESARKPGTFSTVAGGWRPPPEHGFR